VLTSLRLVRGLRNEDGQYNCFLNVIIQALWHLRTFRQRLLAMQPPAAAAAAAAAGPGNGPAGGLSADIQVLHALRAVFQDLAKAPSLPAPAAAAAAAESAAAGDQGSGKAGAAGSSSSASVSGCLVCPVVLREALSRLDLGAAAISIELSEMHDASEVLNEVFTALHHAEAGRAAAVADDPQLPTKLRVRPELFASKRATQQQQAAQQQQQQPQAQQQPQTLAHKLQQQAQQSNGLGGAVMNGVGGPAGSKAGGSSSSGVPHKPPRSLVHTLFGLDVLQAHVPSDSSSSSGGGKKAGGSSGAAGAAAAAAAAAGGSGVRDGVGLIEAQQFMRFFHLVPAQVGVRPTG
jgi:hypothetical protein